jgi:hypothetical protein
METPGVCATAGPELVVGLSGAVRSRARVGEKLVARGVVAEPGLDKMPCRRDEAGPRAGAGVTGCRVTSG